MPGELVAGGGVGGHTSLVIDGKSVSSLYKSTLGWDHLKTLAKTCDAVIACRLSPIQKSQLVRMVKSKSSNESYRKENITLLTSIAECDPANLTAAIGDGGNDGSMLQVKLLRKIIVIMTMTIDNYNSGGPHRAGHHGS